MRRIVAVDCREYPFPPDVIFKVLADVAGYKNWWPRGVMVKVLEKSSNGIDSKIEVWASGGWFRCKVRSFDAPYRVGISYYDGVVYGDSFWSIQALDNQVTKVCYSIDLEPYGFFPRTLSNVVNFSQIHSFQFKRVLRSLQAYLDQMDKLSN